MACLPYTTTAMSFFDILSMRNQRKYSQNWICCYSQYLWSPIDYNSRRK